MEATENRLDAIREQLAPPWAENEKRVVETGSIPVVVDKRGHWYHLKDGSEAVARARALGAPSNWRAIAERVVGEDALNVNRSGVVFVSAVEWRDIAGLVLRVADCAERVQAALLDAA